MQEEEANAWYSVECPVQREESVGYSEVVSEGELFPSLVCQVIDQLLVLSILPHQSLL